MSNLAETSKEERTRGQRKLFIRVMLMFFVSIVVFVVGTYFFVVPRMLQDDLEIAKIRQQVVSLERVVSARP